MSLRDRHAASFDRRLVGRAAFCILDELLQVLIEPIDLLDEPVEHLSIRALSHVRRRFVHLAHFGTRADATKCSVPRAGEDDADGLYRIVTSSLEPMEGRNQGSDVRVSIDDGIAYVSLDRPERRNALSHSVLVQLTELFDALGQSDDVRLVVLEATGSAFSAGHDIAEMVGHDEDWYRDLFTTCTMLMNLLRQLARPVIAKVDGVATAAGCQLVAGCDLAVASDRSTFATPGVRIGLFCSTPLVPVARAIGPKRALEMLLTGEPIDAVTALSWGLVNRVVPADQLDAAIDELARQIMRYSPQVIELGKLAFYEQLALSERGAYEVMTEVMTANALMPDAQEGMSAFLEKRAAVWNEA